MTSVKTATNPRRYLALFIFIAVNLAIGSIGGITTASSVNGWYRSIAKPSFNPPDFIFAPVWTALYLVIAIAAWRIWRLQAPRRTLALRCYGLQLLCNFLWSIFFFGMCNPALALMDMAVMITAAIACQILFLRIDKTAGFLWMPYLAWLSFATVLNASIVFMN